MKKTKLGMIAITAAFLCILLGVFIGRQNSDNRITLIHSDDNLTATDQDNGLVNINTASLEELKLLPGVGEVLAQRIVAYRDENGPFKIAEDLCLVEGIGSKTFETLSKYITVGGNYENSGS